MAGLTLLDLSLLALLVIQPVSFFSFLYGLLLLASFPALGLVYVGTDALRQATYEVEEGVLVVHWGRVQETIPLSQVRALIPGRDCEALTGFRGLRWPGMFWGWGVVRLKNVAHQATFFAARPLADQLFLVTADRAYGISPADGEIFLDALTAIMAATLPRAPSTASRTLGLIGWPLWRDRAAAGLVGAAAGLNLALFAYLSLVAGRLPPTVPLHFAAPGLVDRSGPPVALFILPLAGLLAWLFNAGLGGLLYQARDDRPAAYLLWGGALIVQIAAWVAVIGLIP